MTIEVTDQMLDAARDIVINYDEPACDSCLTKVYEAMEAARRHSCEGQQAVSAIASTSPLDHQVLSEASA